MISINKQRAGFSLIELMVALSLGILLVAGLLRIFMGNKGAFNVQEGLSRLQENGRVVDNFIRYDLRMTTLQGCNNPGLFTPLYLVSSPAPNETFDPTTVITGYQSVGASWSPALPAWLTSTVASGTSIAPGTDVLVIRRQGEQAVQLAQNMAANTDTIVIPNMVSFTPGNIIFITDCENTDIFRATAGTTATSITHTAVSNTTSSLSKAYQTDARVSAMQTNAYYIKNTTRTNNVGNPIFALYRQKIDGTEEELVPGVENMQITYGINTDGDNSADTFLTADAVTANNQWSQVDSISISFLLDTINDVNNKSQSYTYNGATVTPTDKVLRRVWNSYIKIRNRDIT